MRSLFEARVGPSRRPEPDRFIWDYWHVPGQYTYLRTHARRFFPSDLYGRFLTAVRSWGATNLGCDRTSEPWLSFYVQGCRQELHADVPQGPWSFVYSLTDNAGFTGGDTLLLRRAVLDYWTGFDDQRALESDDLVWRIPSRFDQLLVFDSRVPHGVTTVEGTADPIRSRVVIHGWFLTPSLSVQGALGADQASLAIEKLHRSWADIVEACGPLAGVATWRLEVGADGACRPLRLAHTLVATAPAASGPAQALDRMQKVLAEVRFPVATGPSVIVFPVTTAAG